MSIIKGNFLYERAEEKQTSYYLGGGIGGSQIGQQVYYYHQDEQLSTALITDAIGNIQNYYQYDAFGWELEKLSIHLTGYGIQGNNMMCRQSSII